MTDLSELRFFATPPHPCSYLPGESATTVFLDPAAPLAREARLDLLRRDSFEDVLVGAIMSTEFCVLGEELTMPRAIEEVRR
ncbi:MAG: hypothetical protein ACO2YV_12620, partial [Pseudomonadales bacterium]